MEIYTPSLYNPPDGRTIETTIMGEECRLEVGSVGEFQEHIAQELLRLYPFLYPVRDLSGILNIRKSEEPKTIKKTVKRRATRLPA